jgi:hypothetical protein
MYLPATQYMLIPHRRAAYPTVSIAAMTDNRFHCIYAFHRSVPAFGVAGGVGLQCFEEWELAAL